MLSELENSHVVLSFLINRMPQRSVSTLFLLLYKLFEAFFDPLPFTVKNVREIFILKEDFSGFLE